MCKKVVKTENEKFSYQGVTGDTNKNYLIYEKLIKRFPHIHEIMNKMGFSLDYCIQHIWDDDNRIVIYGYSCFAFTTCQPEFYDLLKDYEVTIQAPGNQDYLFSIGINKTLMNRKRCDKCHNYSNHIKGVCIDCNTL